eukprot:311804-Pelagomonas_calceolata.AAC.1
MITNPYSKLLAAYPHLCCKLGTIPKGKLTYDNPGPLASRKLLSLSIPGTYKLLQSGIQLQEST